MAYTFSLVLRPRLGTARTKWARFWTNLSFKFYPASTPKVVSMIQFATLIPIYRLGIRPPLRPLNIVLEKLNTTQCTL